MPVNWFKHYARFCKSNARELLQVKTQIIQMSNKHKAFQVEVNTDKVRAFDIAKYIMDQGLIMDVANWYDGVVILTIGSSRTAMDKLEWLL